jgi:beta-hydroxylase
MYLIYLILSLLLIIGFRYFFFQSISENYKIDQKFYDSEIFPILSTVHNYDIKNEVHRKLQTDLSGNWVDWPEDELYTNAKVDGNWKILPFFAFNTWCNSNCKKFPEITTFLKTIPNLRNATLSKLSPRTSLKPHCGWASNSNYVLRCHYGIILPENQNESFIAVQEDINDQVDTLCHKPNEWIIFDDAKLHYAVNNSNIDRIVLIIDLDRPEYVKKGNSQSVESGEIYDILNEIKKTNIDE